MLAFYERQKNLTVSNVHDAEVGGLRGVVLDIQAAHHVPLAHCTEGAVTVHVNQVISGVAGSEFDHGVIENMTMRLYLLRGREPRHGHRADRHRRCARATGHDGQGGRIAAVRRLTSSAAKDLTHPAQTPPANSLTCRRSIADDRTNFSALAQDARPFGSGHVLGYVDSAPLAAPSHDSDGLVDTLDCEDCHFVDLGRGGGVATVDDIARAEIDALRSGLVQGLWGR